MTLGNRLNRALAELFMLQEGGTPGYNPDKISQGRGGHGAHGDPSRAPRGNSRPLVQQWADRFERMIERAEVDAGIRPAPVGVPRGATREEVKRRIHEYEGCDAVEVAFFERCSLDTVIRVRRDLGLNVRTGERQERRERVLTASARDSLQRLQDTIGGEV
jgi:hypothetical protein